MAQMTLPSGEVIEVPDAVAPTAAPAQPFTPSFDFAADAAGAPPPRVAGIASEADAPPDDYQRQALAQAERPPVDAGQVVMPGAAPAQAVGAPMARGSLGQEMARSVLEQGPSRYYRAATPERDLTTGYTVQSQQALPEETQQTVRQANQTEAEAVQAQAEANVQVARLHASQAEQEAEAAQADIEASRRERAAMNAALGDLKAEMQRKREAVPDGIDPNRWDRTGGFGRVIAAISIGLGGAGQALSGRGGNPGQEILDRIVDQDVRAQESEIAQAQAEAQTAENDYADALATYGDPILAKKQARINSLEAMKKAVQAQIADVGTEAAKAQGAMVMAELNAQQAKEEADMMGLAGTRVEQHAIQQARSGGWVSESTESLFKRAELAKKMGDLASPDPLEGLSSEQRKEADQRKIHMGGGEFAWAPTADEAKSARAIMSARESFKNNIVEMRKTIEQSGTSVSPTDRKRLQTLAQRQTLLLKELEQLGAITEADQQMVEPLTGLGSEKLLRLDSTSLEALRQAEEHVDDRMQGVTRHLWADPTNAQPYRRTTSEGGMQSAGFGD